MKCCVPAAASPRLRGLRGAAGVCSLTSSSNEESGAAGETAGSLSGREFLVEALSVTLVKISVPVKVSVITYRSQI